MKPGKKWTYTFLLLCLFFQTPAQKEVSENRLWQQYRSSKDSSKSVSALIALSETCFQRDRQLSEQLASRAFELAKKNGSPELRIRALIRLTNVTFENSKNQQAVALSTELLKLAEELNDPGYLSEAHRIAGRNFHLRGDYPQALNHYFKGLVFCETTGDTIQMGELYNILGGVYLNQSDYENAFYYYNRSLQIQIKKKNAIRTGRGYLNISNIYTAAKNYKKALQLLDSAMFEYSLAGYEEGKVMVYTTLPEIYLAQNQEDSALYYLHKAHDYLKKVNRTYYLTQIDLQLAKISWMHGRTEDVLRWIDEGITVGNTNRQNHDLMPLYLMRSEVLEKTGRTKEAFESYKVYKQLSDSVINAASIKKQAEEALQYDYDKKQYQQTLEQQEKEKRRQLVITGTVILLVILFFVFSYRYRLKQKANQQLERSNSKLEEKNLLIEEKSKELQTSLNERELLLKEIHHRVKNNLQVISGLLELQKEELTEDSSKAAFDEGQSRIRSISLIHQNLYQNEHLGCIQFKNFVQELTEQVKEVFEQPGQEVAFQFEMPDLVLDIDTAVPLGLILNELLTNSYKYAFSKTKQALVKIVLQELADGNFVLRYSDNGPGIKAGENFESANTLGLRLIKGLSGQIAGNASYHFDQGAVFVIRFKDARARRQE